MHTREEILDSMKRCIKENDGKALGKTRFSKKYKIPIYEIEKFWSKTSDLVIEAGGTPNELYRKYPEGFLEEKVILWIRGGSIPNDKFPTLGELQVVHTHNPDFPFRAIKRRWSHFVRDLVRYCEKNPGHDDILKICQPILEKLDEKEKDNLTDNSSSMAGVVYLCKYGKHHKIGYTNDMVRRDGALRLVLPEIPKYIHEIVTDDPSGVEAYWKNRWKDKAYKKGNRLTDTFNLEPQDIKAFKRWKEIY
jgi:hypothetical protein